MLVIFLVVSLALSHSLALTPCPKCGETEVPEPLSTSPSCGDSRYTLKCDRGFLEFPSSSGGFHYKVLKIDPSERTLTLKPPEIEPDTCRSSDLSPEEGLRIGDGSPFNVSARNTVVLLNCSTALLRSPLNCSSLSLCRRFLKEGYAGACGGKLCCHYLKDSRMSARFIRVREGGCTAYTSIVDIRPSDPVRDWTYGIELQWLPPM